MNKSTSAIWALSITLIVSNLWWIYSAIDSGITFTYQNVSLQDNKEALQQIIQVFPIAMQPGSTKEKVIEAARLPGDSTEKFEKEGFTWIGKIGLRFDKSGKVIEIKKAWEEGIYY